MDICRVLWKLPGVFSRRCTISYPTISSQPFFPTYRLYYASHVNIEYGQSYRLLHSALPLPTKLPCSGGCLWRERCTRCSPSLVTPAYDRFEDSAKVCLRKEQMKDVLLVTQEHPNVANLRTFNWRSRILLRCSFGTLSGRQLFELAW